mmetsp:Transcript_18561/g.41328  ORF Transcript_18561/g.41328 Transcript_18561/m.41328 type:complete len:281 (-) Transcript_18561:207-1049(-)
MPHLQEHISSLGRAKELEFVRKHDSAHAELWYLIDLKWMRRWKQYLNNRGVHPGAISNYHLLEIHRDFRSTRQDLCAKQHYRGVCKQVWDFFEKTYGGGPTIVSDNTMDLKTAKVLPSNAADEELQELAEEERYRRLNSRSSDRSSRQSSMNEKRSSQSNEQSSLRSTSTASFQLRTGSRSSSICSQAVDEDAEAEAAEAEAAEPPAPAEPPSETRKGGGVFAALLAAMHSIGNTKPSPNTRQPQPQQVAPSGTQRPCVEDVQKLEPQQAPPAKRRTIVI